MFFLPSDGNCCSGPKRRTAVLVSAIAAAAVGIAVSLFDHKHDDEGVATGDGSTWHIASIAIMVAVIVTALVVLLVRWKRGQEEG